MIRLNRLKTSSQRPRHPNGSEMEHRSSSYHFTMAELSVWISTASYEVFPSRKHEENRIFYPKNGQKMPFFGLKQCFWGLSGRM